MHCQTRAPWKDQGILHLDEKEQKQKTLLENKCSKTFGSNRSATSLIPSIVAKTLQARANLTMAPVA